MSDSLDLYPPVEVKILDPRLETWGLPRYQSELAAAIDLYACLDEPAHLPPQAAPLLIPSGIAVNMNNPHIAAVVLPRSGLGHKKGLVLGNLVGLIDPDYTGQIMISVWNRSEPGTEPVLIQPGERIAQMMFVPVLRPRLQTVTDFSTITARGAGGFGSTHS